MPALPEGLPAAPAPVGLAEAAARLAGGQQYPAGTLYVVPTPIGNLADVTLRALHVLGLVDAIACEDTRVTANLLRHLGVAAKPLLPLHHHNEAGATQGVLQRLARGERVAYCSDAGTPAVSDPGARLVAGVRAAGHRVLPLPGASSVVTALSAAGDATGAERGFRFDGFLPAKGRERQARLDALAAQPLTTVLFEAPHRIEALVAALASACPARPVTLARELTKQFESVHTDAASALPAWLAADPHRSRGEFVVVLHALAVADLDAGDAEVERLLGVLMRELPLRQAAALAAELSGRPRKQVYQAALDRRAAPDEDDEGREDDEVPQADAHEDAGDPPRGA